jgi:hypothetical protein
VPVLIPKPNAQENDLERALGAFEKIYTLEKRIVRKTDESSTQLLKKSLRLLLLRAGGTLNTGMTTLLHVESLRVRVPPSVTKTKKSGANLSKKRLLP